MIRSLPGAALAVCLAAEPAWANTQTGSLQAPAGDVDYWVVTCADGPNGPAQSLAVAITDLAPAAAPLVSVQAQKAFAATNATDATDGDGGASPTVAVNGGAGSYDVFVDKSALGAEGYSLFAQCRTGADGTGLDASTTIAPAGGSPIPALPPLAALTLTATLCTLTFRKRS